MCSEGFTSFQQGLDNQFNNSGEEMSNIKLSLVEEERGYTNVKDSDLDLFAKQSTQDESMVLREIGLAPYQPQLTIKPQRLFEGEDSNSTEEKFRESIRNMDSKESDGDVLYSTEKDKLCEDILNRFKKVSSIDIDSEQFRKNLDALFAVSMRK